ncbi:MAG: hypothetical protein R3B70_37195 [Polyangiaceae bacterium]
MTAACSKMRRCSSTSFTGSRYRPRAASIPEQPRDSPAAGVRLATFAVGSSIV